MPELQLKTTKFQDYARLGLGADKSHSVLVLQFNASRIDAQLRNTVQQLPQLLSKQVNTEIIAVESEYSLQKRLNELKSARAQYALIVVVGDSNAAQLFVDGEKTQSWTEFAYQTLLPFEPDYLLLLASVNERDIPAHTFFEAVPMLREVYASPVLDRKLQSDVLKFMVNYLVNPAPSEYDRTFSTQIADKLLNTGVLLRWTWRDSLKHRLLNTFELLTDSEKLEVAAEIIQRTAQSTNHRFDSTGTPLR